MGMHVRVSDRVPQVCMHARCTRAPRGQPGQLCAAGRLLASLFRCPYGARVMLAPVGAQAVGVPKSKLALYTACGGIPPNMCLPICIDAGAAPLSSTAGVLQRRRDAARALLDVSRPCIDAGLSPSKLALHACCPVTQRVSSCHGIAALCAVVLETSPVRLNASVREICCPKCVRSARRAARRCSRPGAPGHAPSARSDAQAGGGSGQLSAVPDPDPTHRAAHGAQARITRTCCRVHSTLAASTSACAATPTTSSSTSSCPP